MGRSSAGGGGGGRSSGGGSFRSSGGHRSSGGGRSSRSSGGSGLGGGHKSSGGLGGNPFRGHIHINNRNYYGRGSFGGPDTFGGPGVPPPDSYSRGSYRRRRGGTGVLGSLIAVFLVVWVIFAIINSIASDSGAFAGASGGIQSSSIDREKLPDTMTKETAYYQDDLDWIGSSYDLEKGMKYFYRTTGVFPYLWITDNVDGDSWPTDEKIDDKLNSMYEAFFEDEGHAIIMYLDAGGGRYITRCLRGASAKTVLDDEATEILLDYLDAYASSDLDDETYFATCFTKAADRMMSRTTNRMDAVRAIAVIAGIVIVVIAAVWFFIRRRKLKLEQARVDKDILNSKL